MEVIFELLLEFLLQVFVEILVEFGLQSLSEPFRRKPNPVTAAVGYVLFGALAGAISLIPFPAHLVSIGLPRKVNLVVTPIAVGLVMMALGRWRARNDRPVLRIDRFVYGYVFALAFALVRFHFAD